MGPTASGKTDLAIQLCESYPFEIISVDSAMVYRHMDIGTAKPSQAILQKIPHHLIDIIEPADTYSAADFCADAEKAVEDITSRGKLPLLVGGTMLYFKALQEGLTDLPSADPKIREQILQEATVNGWQSLHETLKKVDPGSAERIHPNDPQRIERALEVYYLTGKSLTDHFAQRRQFCAGHYSFISIGLFPENREYLHQRIETRFNQMLSAGWIEEVEQLISRQQLNFSDPAMKMVGYRQIGCYLRGEMDQKTMFNQSIVATRQLAKRQMTWLRHWPSITLLDPWKTSSLDKINSMITSML